MFFYVVGVEEHPISVCCVEYDQLFSKKSHSTIFAFSIIPAIYTIGDGILAPQMK